PGSSASAIALSTTDRVPIAGAITGVLEWAQRDIRTIITTWMAALTQGMATALQSTFLAGDPSPSISGGRCKEEST
ncbi:hypothetical protein FRC15_005242, partial [Serendipita sp. 397]